MVSSLCHFYGWTVSDCLRLPVRTFFAMYQELSKIEARSFRELLYIAAIPKMNQDYFDMLVTRYSRIVDPNSIEELPPKPPNPSVDAGSQEAKIFLMSQFNRMRKMYGG